jgi:nucleoside-diphosphate kinase
MRKLRELTLGIIKPHAYEDAGFIKQYIADSGLEILLEKETKIRVCTAKQQYEELRSTPYFEDAVRVLTEGTATILALYGRDAVREFSCLVGDKDPAKAADGTIRRMYGIDIERNAIHRTDARENVKREFDIHFTVEEQWKVAEALMERY